MRRKLNFQSIFCHFRKSNKKPKIVIVVQSMLNSVFDGISMNLGERIHIWTRKICDFFEKIHEKAELIFFFKYEVGFIDVENVILKEEKNYLSMLSILDYICKPNVSLDEYPIIVGIQHAMMRNLFAECHKYGTVKSVYERGPQQIAQYMKQNEKDVLAILVSDTNFFIYERVTNIWWTKNCDFNEMTVESFNREEIIKGFGLSKEQLHLLGTLTDSKILPTSILKTSPVGKEINIDHGYIFKRVLDYVRSKQTVNVDQIASEIFGLDATEPLKNVIINGIKSCNMDFDICEETNETNRFLREHFSTLFQMKATPYFLASDVSFIDLRHSISSKLPALMLSIHRKCFGILFANESPRPQHRKVIIKIKHDEIMRARDVPIEYPATEVPSLLELISGRSDERSDELHWHLFCWVFDFDETFTRNRIKR